jgi:hypothetical protein
VWQVILRAVHGFRFPKRWPSALELGAHQNRMNAMRAASPSMPTVLGVPTIKNQGGTGECFGFASVQGIHIDLQAQSKPSTLLSPVLPYWAARREETPADTDITDSGSDPDGMTKALADVGACPWDEDPFDEAKVNDRPNDTAFLAAQQHRCTLLPILATGSELFPAIRHVIEVERHPVLIALNVVPQFDNPHAGGIVDDPTGTSRGLHAQCLFGTRLIGGASGGVAALDAGSWGLDDGVDGIKILTARFIAGAVVWAGSLQVNP